MGCGLVAVHFQNFLTGVFIFFLMYSGHHFFFTFVCACVSTKKQTESPIAAVYFLAHPPLLARDSSLGHTPSVCKRQRVLHTHPLLARDSESCTHTLCWQETSLAHTHTHTLLARDSKSCAHTPLHWHKAPSLANTPTSVGKRQQALATNAI